MSPIVVLISDARGEGVRAQMLMLALATMFLFGGDVLRGFSFVLLVGVLVGTYSSVFVASPMVLLWDRLRRRRA